MTRRPRKAKAARKPSRESSKTLARPKPQRRDPLDGFMATGARALGLRIDKAWMPAVRGHLQVTLRHGGLVAAFVLPDDAEPAPVFKA